MKRASEKKSATAIGVGTGITEDGNRLVTKVCFQFTRKTKPVDENF
jgi:hypothetical protein